LSAEEDALRSIKELNELTTQIERTQAELTLIDETLKQIENGEQIEGTSLKTLGLSSQSPTVLKLRLKGMHSSKQTTLSKYKSKQHSNRELLNDLLKCPACGGLGSKAITTYNRGDGKVTPILNVETCITCNGTGKSIISANILELIKKMHV
jgi:hypothetical protein